MNAFFAFQVVVNLPVQLKSVSAISLTAFQRHSKEEWLREIFKMISLSNSGQR